MCAGAMLCDGNRDELYKQRGIRGSLKASVPNKSYKEPERERGCHNPEMKSGYVRGKADWTEMGSVCRFFCCFFPFLGTGSSGSPTSHSLSFCLEASLPVCCFWLLFWGLFVSRPRTTWNLILSSLSQDKIVFYSKLLDKWFRKKTKTKKTFYEGLLKFRGFGLRRGKLTCMLHWKPTAVWWFLVVP